MRHHKATRAPQILLSRDGSRVLGPHYTHRVGLGEVLKGSSEVLSQSELSLLPQSTHTLSLLP